MRFASAISIIVLAAPLSKSSPAGAQTPTKEVDRLDIISGRPEAFTPTSSRAFWIWRDAANVWHLRATSAHDAHRFTGTLRPNKRAFVSASAARADLADRVKTSG